MRLHLLRERRPLARAGPRPAQGPSFLQSVRPLLCRVSTTCGAVTDLPRVGYKHPLVDWTLVDPAAFCEIEQSHHGKRPEKRHRAPPLLPLVLLAPVEDWADGRKQRVHLFASFDPHSQLLSVIGQPVKHPPKVDHRPEKVLERLGIESPKRWRQRHRPRVFVRDR